MKTYAQYFYSTEKEYNFTIKLAEEVTSKQLDSLEVALNKYDLLSVTTPRKAIMQKNPRDFSNVRNAEIYTMEAKVRYPVAAFELAHMVSEALDIPEKHLVVFCENDPNRAIEEKVIEDSEKVYEPVLTKDYDNESYQDLAGDERRESLLKELEKNKDTVASFAEKPQHEFAPDDYLNKPGNNQSMLNGASAAKVAKKVSKL